MIGFIGAGNMAGAILRGAVERDILDPEEIMIFDTDEAKMRSLCDALGVRAAEDASALTHACDIILIAVKPNIVAGVLNEHRDALAGKALFNIAAGWSTAMLASRLNPTTRVLRIMPNTPLLVGAGMTAFSREHTLNSDEAVFAERLFGALGKVAWVEEYQMEAVTGLSGSGPAYAFLFIEAMADGGVYCGLPRAQALEMAAQTLFGAAKMALESGMHPGQLKDMVCSPGGTTIQAVHSLEQNGFRSSVMDAVRASAEKAAAMKE